MNGNFKLGLLVPKLDFFDVSLNPKHDTAYNTLFDKISLYKSPLSVDFISRGDLFARFLGLENEHFNWVMSLFFLKDGCKAYLCSKYFLDGVDERCINSPSHIGNNTNSHHNLPFPPRPPKRA